MRAILQTGCAAAFWLVTVTCLFSGSAAAELAVGDEAPAFALTGSDGATHTLAEYRGKQPVVLAWFPMAFTPG